jgi:outer membrane receptor for ferrienterochelin and colicin
LIYPGQLPWGFSFSALLKCRSGYRRLAASGDKHELPDGEIVPVYEKIDQPGVVMINCKIDWHLRMFARQEITLSVEIDNLLDKKAHVGKEDDEYEMGRQFWASLEYRF